MCISYEWQRWCLIPEIVLEPSTRSGCTSSWKHCPGCPSWKRPGRQDALGSWCPVLPGWRWELTPRYKGGFLVRRLLCSWHCYSSCWCGSLQLGEEQYKNWNCSCGFVVGGAVCATAVCPHCVHVCDSNTHPFPLWCVCCNEFVCRHSAKNSFKEKNHVVVTIQYEL